MSGCGEGGDGLYAPAVYLTYSYTAPAPTVYVNDGGSGQVVEVPGWGAAPTKIGAGSPTTSYGGFEYNNPAGLALDPAGDVFTPNGSAGTINEIPVGGGSETTIAGGISTPNAVAGDNSNDLLVATAYGVQPVVDGNPQNILVGDTAPGTRGSRSMPRAMCLSPIRNTPPPAESSRCRRTAAPSGRSTDPGAPPAWVR